MSETYTDGLISEMNRFLMGIVHADAWSQVAQEYQKEDEMWLLWEYAEPHLELSVGRPYQIKNQFIFAAVRILHQSKKLRDQNWIDDLPADDRLNYNNLTTLDAGWTHFPAFINSLGAINDSGFVRGTINFRNRLQHRFRSHFHCGHTLSVDRVQTSSGVSYNFNVIRPMPLGELIPRLYDHHKTATEVFAKYWELLVELCQAWEAKYAC